MPDSQPTTPTRLQRWGRLLAQFLVGQACIQFFNLITGFLLLRWLAVEDYAQISVVLAFQGALTSLVDLGFTGSIVALVGEHGKDAEHIGKFIRAAIQLRTRFLVLGLIGASVVFPLLTLRHGWSPVTIVTLFGAVAASITFQAWQVYGAPLLINRRLQAYYTPQIIAAIGRLGACALLHVGGVLNSGLAAWIAAFTIAYTGWCYKQSSKPFIVEPKVPGAEPRREMVKYLAPLMPGLIFTAIQGQITIGIITIFGKTANIAQVAALGRLAQIFLVLGAFNSAIIEPLIARTASSNLMRRYLTIIGGAVACVAVISVFSFVFPQLLLWLLGPKYHNVGQSIGWSVLAASIGYVSSVLWTMNSARKWVFWWYTGLYIALVCIAQVICVLTFDLSTTLGVMYFSVITGVASLVSHIVCAIYGLINNRHTGQVGQPLESSEDDNDSSISSNPEGAINTC